MKRYGAALALLALAVVTGGAGYGPSSKTTAAGHLDRDVNPRHGTSDYEYLRPEYVEPKATLVLLFADWNTTHYDFVFGHLNAIRDSTSFGGVDWGDSSDIAGADIRATFVGDPDELDTGSKLTTAELVEIAGKTPYYEIATHANRLGSRGLTTDSTQVQSPNVTGRSRAFLDDQLDELQDDLYAAIGRYATTHTQNNNKTVLGEQAVWRQNGYYQVVGAAVRANLEYDSADGPSNGFTSRQRNVDEFALATMQRAGVPVMAGMHTIGERFDPYDIGVASFNHGTSNGGRQLIDSVKVAVDVALRYGDQYWIGFHRVTNDSAASDSSITCGEAEFIELLAFCGERINAGDMQSLTIEQATADLRSIRDGELFAHRGFKLAGDYTRTSAISGELAPFGFASVGASLFNFYRVAQDTFVAAGGTATNPKAISDWDTVRTAFAADSLVSYGVADTSGNFIIYDMFAAAHSQHLTFAVRTSGTRARAVRIAVEVLPMGTPGWDQDVTMLGKFGQFEEVWEDNVNFNGAAYAIMSNLLGTRVNAPAFSGDMRSFRVRPQFNPFLGDTSLVGVPDSVAVDGGRAIGFTNDISLYSALSPYQLRSMWVGALASEMDFPATYGNVVGLTAATGSDQDHDENWQGMNGVWPTDHYWFVPVNEHTDYIYCKVAPYASVPMASAGTFVVLNISAQPVR